MTRLLLIEAELDKVGRFKDLVADALDVTCKATLADGLSFASQNKVDIVIASLNGEEKLSLFHESLPELPIIILTSSEDEELLSEGAQDVLVWDNLEQKSLTRAIRYAIKRQKVLVDLETSQFAFKSAVLARRYFLASLSHQIRTPVTSILGAIELFPENNLSDEQKQYFDVIKSSASFLSSLMPHVLDISKVEEGESFTLSMQEFDLENLFQQLKNTFFVQCQQSEVELSFVLGDNIPPRIIGDHQRISQVLTNLITNSLRANPQGHIRVSAKLNDSLPESPEIGFAVQDSGTNLSDQKQKAMISAFESFPNLASERGVGFGLLIAKKLVEVMGGNIELKSDQESGNTYCFTLPLLQKQSSDLLEEAFPESLSFLSAIGEPPRLRVLLVEDDSTNQIVIRKLLEKLGHSAILAPSGETALDLLGRDIFDLVLMDIELPDIDGMEATKLIRKNDQASGQYTAVIAMTAHASGDYQERCMELGMDDFLPKPVSRRDLEKAIFGVYERLVLQIRH